MRKIDEDYIKVVKIINSINNITQIGTGRRCIEAFESTHCNNSIVDKSLIDGLRNIKMADTLYLILDLKRLSFKRMMD